MGRALFALFLLCLGLHPATPALAETARVTGGEHEDFTRLVVEAVEQIAGEKEGGKDSDWRFGRTQDGYALALSPSITSFDITEAFRRIPRTRITSLWQDPDTGHLRLSLACACHAIAFEYRPGITVIDIRNGPAPKSSVFEAALDVPLAVQPNPEPAEPSGYDWLAIARTRSAAPADALAMPMPTGEISLDPLRDALLAQISRGASDTVVEVVEVLPDTDRGPSQTQDAPWSRISVGEMPGLRAAVEGDQTPPLTADGKNCMADSDLDIANWGMEGPAIAQLGLGRAGLMSEFDQPDAEATLRAARLHLSLGFGAEARQLLGLLGYGQSEEIRLLSDLSHIVDLDPLPYSMFSGQESCATAAALWAVLAGLGHPLPRYTNVDAVARSFAALPPPLRRYLGPPLADAFLAADQGDSARIIRDAILRLPSEHGAEVDLLEARFQLANGHAPEAGAAAAEVLSQGGRASAEAAITLVEASFRGTRQLDPNVPLILQSFLKESLGTPLHPRLLHARILAAALTEDYETAFDLVETSPRSLADLWVLAATQTADDMFLAEAAKAAAHPPNIAKETTRQVAERLFSLGFHDLSLQWLGPVDMSSDEDSRLMAARARLGLRDVPTALTLLAGLTTAEATKLRAEAVLQIGDAEAAATALIAAGEEQAGQRALTWTQDWPLIAAEGPENWRAAATALEQTEPALGGPIARGSALAEDSAAAREVIETLLLSQVEASP